MFVPFYHFWSLKVRDNACSKCMNYISATVQYDVFHYRYTLGFILWNIDNHFCPRITQLRDSLRPAPTAAEADSPHPLRGLLDLSPLTQLHGWWHLLAGYGTYVHIVFCIHNR